jgi:hypothetical protein
VVQACNPSYSGGRDQEDRGSKLAWADQSRDPISKIPNTKKASGVAQGVAPVPQKKKKKKKKPVYHLPSLITIQEWRAVSCSHLKWEHAISVYYGTY